MINNKISKRLRYINDQLHEVELAESEIEQKEPNFLGFFIRQNAKLRRLEIYYNFFAKFCDTDTSEEMEMDTDSLFLVLAEKELYDCIRTEKRQEWEWIVT